MISNPIIAEDLSPWLIGRTIKQISYQDGVLALTLDDKSHFICYTEVIAKGVPK